LLIHTTLALLQLSESAREDKLPYKDKGYIYTHAYHTVPVLMIDNKLSKTKKI
jgi:hypothetical protein